MSSVMDAAISDDPVAPASPEAAPRTVTGGQADVWRTDSRPGLEALLASLTSLDRDLLKDTLGVVKRFKALMRQRFHLDMVS